MSETYQFLEQLAQLRAENAELRAKIKVLVDLIHALGEALQELR